MHQYKCKVRKKMSEITIRPISSKKDLKKFIYFNYELYKGSEYAVPDLYQDMVNTFDPKENPGLDFCDIQLFLAERDGKVVGRVAAIINKRANTTWNTKNVRFGWIDFIDDQAVSKALLNAVEEWGRERGMERVVGPMGITDMDKEGMLYEGYDRIGTASTYYNYPYYNDHMVAHGYGKEVDWEERRVPVPTEIPEKYAKVGKIVTERNKVHVKKMKSKQEIYDGYGRKIFELVNSAYAPLYGYSQMTDAQINHYVKMFIPLLDMRMLTLVEKDDTNELVALGISMPSMVRAMQKSGGRMLPFGWFHLLKSLKFKHEDGVELLLIAVKPEYQNTGVNALLFCDLIPIYQKMGFKWAETNPILETNNKSAGQWKYFEHEIVKRRRAYSKDL